MVIHFFEDQTFPERNPPGSPSAGRAIAFQSMMDIMDPGRHAHYRQFHEGPPGDEPIALVLGNCQAESVRIILGNSSTFPGTLVRVPPVHELTFRDLAPLHRLLERTEILLTQPINADYRGLPVGTEQLRERLPRSAFVVRFPIVRYGGLHPYTVIVRHAADRSAVPPVVPYHDLRLLSRLAGRTRGPDGEPTPEAVRTVAELSIAELRRRERTQTDVAVSDLLVPAGAQAVRTPNHPGNPVVLGLAHRIQRALGLPADAADPGRPLLNDIHAPLTRAVVTTWGLDADVRPRWVVAGEPVDEHILWKEHRRWYEQHPQWIEAGVERHRRQLTALGL